MAERTVEVKKGNRIISVTESWLRTEIGLIRSLGNTSIVMSSVSEGFLIYNQLFTHNADLPTDGKIIIGIGGVAIAAAGIWFRKNATNLENFLNTNETTNPKIHD